MEVFVTIVVLIVLVLLLKNNQPAVPWKEKLKPSKGVMVVVAVPILMGLSLGIADSIFPECGTVSCLLANVF